MTSLVTGSDGVGLDVMVVILGFVNLDEIGHDLSELALGSFVVSHDLYLDTEDTLSEFDVSDGLIDEFELGLTGGDHVTLLVFLGLCSLTSDLTRDNDFATLGTTSS